MNSKGSQFDIDRYFKEISVNKNAAFANARKGSTGSNGTSTTGGNSNNSKRRREGALSNANGGTNNGINSGHRRYNSKRNRSGQGDISDTTDGGDGEEDYDSQDDFGTDTTSKRRVKKARRDSDASYHGSGFNRTTSTLSKTSSNLGLGGGRDGDDSHYSDSNNSKPNGRTLSNRTDSVDSTKRWSLRSNNRRRSQPSFTNEDEETDDILDEDVDGEDDEDRYMDEEDDECLNPSSQTTYILGNSTATSNSAPTTTVISNRNYNNNNNNSMTS